MKDKINEFINTNRDDIHMVLDIIIIVLLVVVIVVGPIV